MLVSETHFTQKSFLRIKKYKIYATNHPAGTARGGSAIIIKDIINHTVKRPFKENHIQATSVQITSINLPLIISAIYCPPSQNIEEKDFSTFFKELGTRFIAGGDYNAKHTMWGSRLVTNRGRELLKTTRKLNLSHISTGEPTYWPSDLNKMPDLIDFCIFKGIEQRHLEASSCFDLSSDHSPILVTVNHSVQLKQKNPSVHSKFTNWPRFRQIVNETLSINVPLKDDNDIENAVKMFTTVIQNAGWESTPKTTYFNKKTSIHPEIKIKLIEKRKLRRRWQNSRHPEDKRKLNIVTKEVKELLTQHTQQEMEDRLSHLTATKETEYSLWKATKSIKQPKKQNPPIKTSNGTWARSDKEKANKFAEHLSKVFTPLATNDRREEESIETLLHAPGQLDFPIPNFTKIQVKKECLKLKKDKAPGYDLITAKVLHELPEIGYQYLTQLFNAISRCAHFPLQWKVSQIIMLPKPGKPPTDVTSYRPISLLPIVSKVYEKLFLIKLRPIINSKQLIPNHQFGFREKHGTIEQVHRVHRNIKTAIEKKEYSTAAFLDVTQAFDKVWIEGLLFKLKLNLPYPYYEVLKSYLSDRHFMIKLNEELTSIHDIKSGVPQGSVLGPLLYTLYTSDFPATENVTVATFADDTVLLASHENPATASNHLQNALSEVDKWLRRWKIQANSTKSTQVTFTNRRDQCPPVLLNGQQLPADDSAKYLGIHLDKRLTWRKHIFTKRKQLGLQFTKMYWLIGKHSKLSLNNKLTVYKAVLKPIWLYGIQLWGSAAKSNIAIIQRFQSKVLRVITGAPWYVSNENLHRDLNMPTVEEEVQRYNTSYANRLQAHPNALATQLLEPSRNTPPRLKRFQQRNLVVLR